MNSRPTCLFAGLFLIGLSAFYLVHGARAALAQAIYYQSKFGSTADNTRAVIRRCGAAFNLYTYNYNFCSWSAEKAYESAGEQRGAEQREMLEAAETWCDHGLNLNPYKVNLRYLKTVLIAADSLEKAIQYWKKYVEWDFWNPENHEFLLDLYIESGEYEKAGEELKWLEGTGMRKKAQKRLSKAIKRQATSAQ